MTPRSTRRTRSGPPDRKSVLLDVFVDGDFAVQLEMTWQKALDVAADILVCQVRAKPPSEPTGPMPRRHGAM
jgi:hypothetical protein